MPHFHDECAVRRQQPRRLRNQRAIGIKSVRAAVEGAQRVEIADLGGETGDVGALMAAAGLAPEGDAKADLAGIRRAVAGRKKPS